MEGAELEIEKVFKTSSQYIWYHHVFEFAVMFIPKLRLGYVISLGIYA